MDRDTESVAPEPLPLLLAEQLPAGSRLGERYEIVRTLGSGGSAVVYQAIDHELKQQIALKVMRSDRTTASALKRFRREVGIARDVASPHLVRIYDIQTLDDRLCISMELIEGDTLRELIVREGKLEIERALEITKELLAALAELHAHGIVHRDVKPGNILFDEEGRVRLTDLGLALRWDSDESRATVTQGVVGTFEYLSPEQALGQEVDGRSDLYSAGIVLYEMLTGQLPFDARSSLGSAVARVHTRAGQVRAVRQDTPRWLAQLVSGLLQRDRAARYGSADEVLQALARRSYSWRQTWRSSRVRAASAALGLLLVAALIMGAMQWRDSRFAVVTQGEHDLVARDARGRVLWSMDGEHHAQVFRAGDGGRMVAAIRNPKPGAPYGEEAHELLLIEPQSGKRVQMVRIPRLNTFRQFSPRFHVNQIVATDLDGDERDELFIVYSHAIYWPSYTILYEPLSGSVRVLLLASGHHRVAGTADLDGDGRRELLFLGINNRMGWAWAAAALDVSKPGTSLFGISTPDHDYDNTSPAGLRWYKLLPLGRFNQSIEVDEVHRTITFTRTDGRTVVLGFDGFERTSRPEAADRSKAREESYSLVRRITRLLTDGQPHRAIPLGREALALSQGAGDPELSQWIARLEIRAHIESGDPMAAEELLSRLLERAEAKGAVVWDAALAYHLHGELEAAVRWYATGLDPEDNILAGRLRWEYAEGVVLALVEAGELDRARGLLRRAMEIHPEHGYMDDLALYLDWREKKPESTPLSIGSPSDLARYWKLELDLATGHDPGAVLALIHDHLKIVSGTTVPLRSLEAECLTRLGRHSEAAAAIMEAWRLTVIEAARDPHVRAHADVIYERLISILPAAGRGDEVVLMQKQARALAQQHRIRTLQQ